MPITQDSFRDPRKHYALRVISPFFLEGREPTKVGEIIHVPRSRASELVHSNKAVRLTAEEIAELSKPAPAATPVAPAPEVVATTTATTGTISTKSSKEK